jgi:hypothetical protein
MPQADGDNIKYLRPALQRDEFQLWITRPFIVCCPFRHLVSTTGHEEEGNDPDFVLAEFP